MVEILVKQPLDGHTPTYAERVLLPEPHDYRADLKRIGETNGFKVAD